MVRIAICDDEPVWCDVLKQKLTGLMEQRREAYEISCHADAEELIHSMGETDILFLDIRMPGLDGMEAARRIRAAGNCCALIFITVLKECALDAFEVEAVDYICKPVEDVQLERALLRALGHTADKKGKALFIRSINRCRSVKQERILYCEVINRKIHIHTQGEVIEYYGKMEELETQLDSRFLKCHRSFMVNLDYLYEYTGEQIVLSNKEAVPVSRLRRQQVKNALLLYMAGR